MDLKDRITWAREQAGITEAAELAHRIGVKPSAIYQLENGTTKSLKATTALAIADKTGVSIRWLVTDQGPRLPVAAQADRAMLAKAVVTARKETAGRRLTIEQEAAVIAFLYGRMVEGAGVDAARSAVLGMLHAFSLEPMKSA